MMLKRVQNDTQQSLSCAFTGHRFLESDFSERKLKKTIDALIKKGVDHFYNGMAMGFDLLAAETVLAAKKKYPQIRLICCIPCPAQDKFFSEEDKQRYAAVLERADEQILLSNYYFKECMLKRNRYMCDCADFLIAYCNKPTGGTAYTVRYFQKQKPENEIFYL